MEFCTELEKGATGIAEYNKNCKKEMTEWYSFYNMRYVRYEVFDRVAAIIDNDPIIFNNFA